jgi:hypothetical protein
MMQFEALARNLTRRGARPAASLERAAEFPRL